MTCGQEVSLNKLFGAVQGGEKMPNYIVYKKILRDYFFQFFWKKMLNPL